jgi:mono/diheme cytochrome c family protein
MRRAALLLGVLVLAGCGGGKTVSPTGKVIGTLAKPAAPKAVALPKGSATAGKALFASNGCSGCHTYKPAGSAAQIGPDLDKLASYAKTADRGALPAFTAESIVNPSAYVQPGYQDVMPHTYAKLPKKQLADLVAFLSTP